MLKALNKTQEVLILARSKAKNRVIRGDNNLHSKLDKKELVAFELDLIDLMSDEFTSYEKIISKKDTYIDALRKENKELTETIQRQNAPK